MNGTMSPYALHAPVSALPYPLVRFSVYYLKQEPYPEEPHVRVCAGAPGNRRSYRDHRPPGMTSEGVMTIFKGTYN